MLKVKDVSVVDGRGNVNLVTGVLSDDHKFIAASQTRAYVSEWKPSTTPGSDNKVRSIGFGETSIFVATNVQVDETNEFATAEMDLIMGPLGIRVQEIKQPNGDTFTSINSFLNEDHGRGDNAKKFKDITNKSICDVVIESLNIASEEMLLPRKEVNSKVARAVGAWGQAVAKIDANKKKVIVADVSESQVSGMTASEVFDN